MRFRLGAAWSHHAGRWYVSAAAVWVGSHVGIRPVERRRLKTFVG